MQQFVSTSPYSNEAFAYYDPFDLDGLDEVMERAAEAQQIWQDLSPADRARHLGNLARALEEKQEDLAILATREMGKPLAESRAEVEKCAWVCRYYSENGEAQLADTPIATENHKSYISYQPLGVLLAIMPWNFPYWQVFRFLSAALMSGNAVVLKHASNVPGCAVAIEKLLRRAGLPEHLMRTLLVGAAESQALIAHPGVQGVTFTGSTAAGRKIAATAGEHIKKTVMELGGSDPYLVLDDADLEKTVETCVASRLINNGQSCIAAKRFIVHDSLHGEFVDRMAGLMSDKRAGDPLREDIDLGPLARPDLCETLSGQVQGSVEAGAELVLGGRGQGNFYLPSVLTEVRPGMPAFDEELFGPVAAVIRAGSDEEAVTLANQSPYGLGAAVFTRDLSRGEFIARRRLKAGACFVNAFVASDPRLPFGGVKASGYGRELGPVGIREFTNIKSVVVTSP